MNEALVLSYAGCSTCTRALKWLESRGVRTKVRPIVLEPPTTAELDVWIAASGVGVRKWLNTSGQSYRALGKPKVDAATDAELVGMLANDGKLVKRPVLVVGKGTGVVGKGTEPKGSVSVLVGFREEAWEALFPR